MTLVAALALSGVLAAPPSAPFPIDDYRLVEMYTFVAAVYFVMSYTLSLLVKRLQERIAIVR